MIRLLIAAMMFVTLIGLSHIVDVSAVDVCGSLMVVGDYCTHGPDAPLGESLALSSLTGTVPSVAVSCGVDGRRVQVAYVRGEESPDRYADMANHIAYMANYTDGLFDQSAHMTGGHRHIRFVTDADCRIVVDNLVVSEEAVASFMGLISVLPADADRKYLLFVDGAPYCGIATMYYDDQPGVQNLSNQRTGWAAIGPSCWYMPAVVVHELTHTLGGVQLSAPHSTGASHCTDEWDALCYSDDPFHPDMTYPCMEANNEMLLDCGKDDYFSTNPVAGSYLATRWNVADSDWLTSDERRVFFAMVWN